MTQKFPLVRCAKSSTGPSLSGPPIASLGVMQISKAGAVAIITLIATGTPSYAQAVRIDDEAGLYAEDIISETPLDDDSLDRVDERKLAVCISAIYLAGYGAISPSMKLRSFVKGVGGIRWAAKLLIGASTHAEKARVIEQVVRGAATEILGLDAISDNC